MARGVPKPRKGRGKWAWRSRQKRGAIMSPSTFRAIEERETRRLGSRERGRRSAGATYQRTLESKYRQERGDDNGRLVD